MGMNPRTLRPSASGFNPRQISGLALWLDAADSQTLYTTDAGPVTAVSAPTEISGCVGWYDFSDSSSLTVTSGSIDACNDKSGNGFHLSASSTNRPTLASAVRNGRNAADFDGVNDLMTATFSGTYTAATVFAVVYPDTAGGGSLGRLFTRGNSLLSYDNTNTAIRFSPPFTGATGNGGQRTANGSAAQDQWHLASFTWNGGLNVATDITPYLSGVVSNAALTGTGDAVSTIGINDFILGNRSLADGADRGWDGYIAEIILFNTALSTANRARVEAYLAAKWGISGVHAQATATNDPVGAWRNKAAAGGTFTQSTSTMRPALTGGYQNGKPAIVSDGVDDWLSASPASIGVASAAAATGVFVTRRAAAGSAAGWDFGTNLSGQQSAGSGLVYDDFFRSVRTPGTFSGQTASITSITSPGSGGRGWRINGAQMSFVDSGAFAVPATAYVLGGPTFPSGFTSFGGGMCEALIYTRVLSEAEVAALERYLASKWGITLAPQVSNADAQDWVNRVYANGGAVSATTASAVNTFCDAIDAAGIRDRFYRLNLFCGNSDASLNAVRTPLYRGPSLSGTQYGNTTDANANFVAADYSEASGLKGNGSTKYLDTGLAMTFLGTNQVHMFVSFNPEAAEFKALLAARFNLAGSMSVENNYNGTTANRPRISLFSVGVSPSDDCSPITGRTQYLVNYDGSQPILVLGRNVSLNNINNAGAYSGTNTESFLVFAGTQTGTGVISHSAQRIDAYSVGAAFTSDAQRTAFHNAMAAFRTALGRT